MNRDNDSWARKRTVSNAEYDLRWEYATSGMALEEFNRRLQEIRNERTTATDTPK
jgi:hypothetical protein